MKIISHNFLEKTIIFFYLIVFFIPELNTVDRIAPQFLYLSILNTLSITVVLIKLKGKAQSIWKNVNPLVSYFIYCLIALISIFFSLNATESIVILNQEFIYLFSFIVLTILFSSIETNIDKYLLQLISLLLAVELISIFSPIFRDYLSNGFIERSNNYRGSSGNINITSFSVLYKTSLILFFWAKQKTTLNNTWNIVVFSLISSSLVVPFFMGTRSGYIGSLITTGCILFYMIFYKSNRVYLKYFISIFFSISLFSFITLSSSKSLNVLDRSSTISLSTQDGSVNQRLRYYNHAFNYFLDNPLTGRGIGNWKLESIKYDKDDIYGYIIPYHAHNDALQILAETGIFGLIFYLLFIGIPVFCVMKTYSYRQNKSWDNLFLLCFFGMYFLDMMLNFPKARPISQIFLIFVISYISRYIFINSFRSFNAKYLIIASFFISLSTIYPSYKMYNSFAEQVFLFFDWNRPKLYFPWEEIKNFEDDFPNISSTGLPLKTMKARYLIQDKRFEEAHSLLNISKKDNPYLGVQEIIKAQAFINQQEMDSAYVNAKKAYFKLQNNGIHTAAYLGLLGTLKLNKELDSVYLARKEKSFNFMINYLKSAYEIQGYGNPDLIKKFNDLKREYPNEDALIDLEKFIKIGNQNLLKSKIVSQEGDRLFGLNKLSEALEKYKEASRIDFTEYAYKESLGIIYFKLDKYEKAIKIFQNVLKDHQTKDGKTEFYLAMIYLDDTKFKDKNLSCDYLRKSISKGYDAADDFYKLYCF